jgi:lipopolysaccharide/colanic/teichoic acid biosynthesis glycosyltransferase
MSTCDIEVTRPITPVADGLKRAFDFMLALTIVILIAPLLLLLALCVRLSSPGPILFRHQRVGRYGRLFRICKFRSMRVTSGGPDLTSADDRRITPLGRFLRRWKLDELPQLFNVLRGDMSLVGPRPEAPRFVALYTAEQRQVLSVWPGITGRAQLQFRNEEALLAGHEDVERFYIENVMPLKLDIDLGYLRERTLARDMIVLLQTVMVVFHRGAMAAGTS